MICMFVHSWVWANQINTLSGRADCKVPFPGELRGLQCWEEDWLGEVGEGWGGLLRGKDLKDFHVLLVPVLWGQFCDGLDSSRQRCLDLPLQARCWGSLWGCWAPVCQVINMMAFLAKAEAAPPPPYPPSYFLVFIPLLWAVVGSGIHFSGSTPESARLVASLRPPGSASSSCVLVSASD